MKLIPLKYDFCIKEVMENETVRRHFISDVLAIPLKDIKSVRMINPFLWKHYKKQKLGILELHTIELKKKPDKGQPSPLDEWHSLFNAKTEEELDMIKSWTKNLGIIEAIKELKEISLTDRLRYEHEMRLKAKRDRQAEDMFVYESGIKAGREDGMKAGREDGMKIGREDEREKSIKILVNTLREHGVIDEQIVRSLMEKYGLSKEEAEGKLR